VPRALMEASLLDGPLAEPVLLESVPVREDQFDQVADTIVDAYQGRPDRHLHSEVEETADATEFLRYVFAGGHGEYRPEFCRAHWREGRCAGVLMGCRVAPDHGFVLQVAVRRDHQGRGLGTELLRDAASAFRDAGLSRVALGVTLANPARHLYERLGFRIVHPVESYVWRRA
jgi:ribosomal protein S18 acetylase RimI-like enzyme